MVVSALAGVTDLLEQAFDSARQGRLDALEPLLSDGQDALAITGRASATPMLLLPANWQLQYTIRRPTQPGAGRPVNCVVGHVM